MSHTLDVLILRLDAPLMSFGAPIVDQQGKIQAFPAQSLISGLVANALGYDRSEHQRLAQLQRRLRYAVREDRTGQKITDYQTVDLTTPHMSSYVWTKSGRKKRRSKIKNKPREILHRDYWADTIHTVALTLDTVDEEPTLDDVEHAVQYPARPLFIGRKTCLPATPLFVKRMQVNRLRDALADPETLSGRADKRSKYPAWWPVDENDPTPNKDDPAKENIRKPVTDRRDWQNQIHVGDRWVAEGEIEVIKDKESHD